MDISKNAIMIRCEKRLRARKNDIMNVLVELKDIRMKYNYLDGTTFCNNISLPIEQLEWQEDSFFELYYFFTTKNLRKAFFSYYKIQIEQKILEIENNRLRAESKDHKTLYFQKLLIKMKGAEKTPIYNELQFDPELLPDNYQILTTTNFYNPLIAAHSHYFYARDYNGHEKDKILPTALDIVLDEKKATDKMNSFIHTCHPVDFDYLTKNKISNNNGYYFRQLNYLIGAIEWAQQTRDFQSILSLCQNLEMFKSILDECHKTVFKDLLLNTGIFQDTKIFKLQRETPVTCVGVEAIEYIIAEESELFRLESRHKDSDRRVEVIKKKYQEISIEPITTPSGNKRFYSILDDLFGELSTITTEDRFPFKNPFTEILLGNEINYSHIALCLESPLFKDIHLKPVNDDTMEAKTITPFYIPEDFKPLTWVSLVRIYDVFSELEKRNIIEVNETYYQWKESVTVNQDNEDFTTSFTFGKKIQKIKWKLFNTQLRYFLNKLSYDTFTTTININLWASSVFLYKNGNEFDSKSIRETKSLFNSTELPKNSDYLKIYELFKNLKIKK